MKTLKDFSAFKLNKNQMGAMKGGATCTLIYTDGYEMQLTNDQMTAQEGFDYVEDAYGWQIEKGYIVNYFCVGR